ncbi:MAG: hypothetical protein Ct9H300mP12_16790 [Acidimicrobiales bacterium]|nr:MAG: hypothetical protein Ct9H300mP12_16790 [Acidimicrobiales bacterium]
MRTGGTGSDCPRALADLGLTEVRRLAPGEEVAVEGPVLLAFDGERKRRLTVGERVYLSVVRMVRGWWTCRR